jgi:hypothetical protein
MRIITYFFLLAFLTLITLSVFVATEDGRYYIEKKIVIPVSKDKVYNYVLDFKNWESFNPFEKESKNIVFNFPSNNKNTANNYFTWNTKKGVFGKIESFYTVKNDSIAQIMIQNDKEIELFWKFEDSLKSTKVTWVAKGNKSFIDKFNSVIYNTKNASIENILETGLTNLNKFLSNDINTFNISVEGLVSRDTIFYLQQLAKCNANDLPIKIKSIVPKLNQLVKSTGTKTKGSPFVVYHSKDTLNNKITISLAIPTTIKIRTSSQSDIIAGQIMPFSAVRATLEGDYSHKEKLLTAVYKYMAEKKLNQDYSRKVIEVIYRNITTDKQVANWVTHIYVPIIIKKPVIKPKPIPVDSIKIIKDSLFNF